jgi:hypothetical protein
VGTRNRHGAEVENRRLNSTVSRLAQAGGVNIFSFALSLAHAEGVKCLISVIFGVDRKQVTLRPSIFRCILGLFDASRIPQTSSQAADLSMKALNYQPEDGTQMALGSDVSMHPI